MIAIQLHGHGLARVHEPVTLGVPFAKGALRNPDDLRLADQHQQLIPLQTEVLERWGDGSCRWVLCDWQASVTDAATYQLRIDPNVPRPVLLDSIRPNFDLVLSLKGIGWQQELGFAEPIWQNCWKPETTGSLRNSYLFDNAAVVADTDLPVHVRGRFHYFAGQNVARVHLTVHNPAKADHPGGLWDLGNDGSVYLTSAAVQLRAHGDGQYSWQTGEPFQKTHTAELYQHSSGGENWDSSNHIDRYRKIPMAQRGYTTQVDDVAGQGLRASPIVLRGSKGLSFPLCWQNFPKRLQSTPEGLSLDLFPAISEPSANEIQGGEQKTHVFYFAYDKDTITAAPLEWTRQPLLPTLDPAYVESTQAVKYLTAKARDPHTIYLQLVDQAITGEDTFFHKRELIDQYGWRHYGDIYGDHEAVYHPGPKPLVSHYNNQYDPVAGFGYQWLRSGQADWFSQMRDLAQHVIDIDIYNTDADKAAYNHGLFWHTYHYVDADTGTHRTYPKNGRIPKHGPPAPGEKLPTITWGKQVPGGGPGNEQNYAHGLLLYYYLTGDRQAREASVGLAQWVIDMDDGRKTIFRWLTQHHTGLASSSRDPSYHGPGRGAANSVSALCDGFRLTGDRKFIDKAEQLIRRVVHPTDNVSRILAMTHQGKTVVDAENRWFYTMFLQALGKYLDIKAERNELDSMYAYAQAVLLHYARWMYEHEALYLDNAAILEYPTETWPAQDMRKCDIFLFAAQHSEGEERQRFLVKAHDFQERAVASLNTFPTKSLCRPVVLLLSFGWMRAWFTHHPESTLPKPKEMSGSFGSPTRFVPQKDIFKSRAKKLFAAGWLVIAAAGIIWFFG